MKYGYFDDQEREYVITRPDTPSPWANYLGSPKFGAVISNNAGGYSFARSGADGRILRYVFNEFDEPGRYVYIRDNDTADYWSASWKPCRKDPGAYSCECRHGTGYTKISADYDGIHSGVLYYVPLDNEHEVWAVSIRNDSGRCRHLTVTGYAEFTNHGNYEQDQVNLQYSLFITQTHFEENRIHQTIQENLREQESRNNDEVSDRFFGLAGAEVSSWCGDRSAFLGNGHRYDNPAGVEKGNLGDVDNYCLNSCGALSTILTLAPGEEKTFAFVLGMKDSAEAAEILSGYERDPAGKTGQELQELKTWWQCRLDHLQVRTPDPAFNTMMNTWNGYNCFMTFIWSRAASFYYCGLRNGYGYRDTVQDIQGVIHLAPEMAVEQIRFMLSGQVDNGAGLPLVKFTHNPGHEDTPDDASYRQSTGHPAYRADDALWLFPTVYKYIAETGNTAFLDEVIPYANRDEGSVYDHLKRAIAFSASHLGPHGMPAGLYADWNDCLRLGAQGESTFVAFQYCYAMRIMKTFAALKNDEDYISRLDTELQKEEEIIERCCWDEDRYIRGFTESGQVIGDRRDPEASMWLNPQSWSVISGVASPEEGDRALQSVSDILDTEYGVMLMYPAYRKHAFKGALMGLYNPGTKENAGIFQQPQGWLILAEALKGHGNRAFRYYKENCPAAMNEQAQVREMEPYCFGQFTEGKDSPYFGRSHVHWLTGTASTVMVGCVEGILGLRPDAAGIAIAPAIPGEWEKFEIDKDFRGHHLHIVVENPGHAESGFRSMTLNGERLGSNYIPAGRLGERNEIVLRMS